MYAAISLGHSLELNPKYGENTHGGLEVPNRFSAWQDHSTWTLKCLEQAALAHIGEEAGELEGIRDVQGAKRKTQTHSSKVNRVIQEETLGHSIASYPGFLLCLRPIRHFLPLTTVWDVASEVREHCLLWVSLS